MLWFWGWQCCWLWVAGKMEKSKQTLRNRILGLEKKICLPVKHNSLAGDVWDYVYNSTGQITKATRTSPNDSYFNYYELVKYNNAGQIEKIRRFQIGTGECVEDRIYAYSPDSLLISEAIYKRTIPTDSTTIRFASVNNYEYDLVKRLVKMHQGGQIISFTYLPNGQIQENDYDGNTQTHLNQSRILGFNTSKAPWGKVAYLNLPSNFLNYADGILFNKLPNAVVLTSYNPDGSIKHQNSFTFNYTYTYNSDGYPLEQIMTTAGQGPLKNTWTYNCQ